MTNPADQVEIITSVQRRRRWTASEKVRIVEETFEPGMTVSLVARRHGVAPNQLFTWRRLVAQGARHRKTHDNARKEKRKGETKRELRPRDGQPLRPESLLAQIDKDCASRQAEHGDTD